MKKSVNLYFGYNISYKERISAIKEAGFDEFYCGVCDGGKDSNLSDIVQYAANLGLKCTMIHCLYDGERLHYFWERGENGDMVCDDYCRQIESCRGLTKNFVIHLNGSKKEKQSKYGLLRLKKILQVCEQCNINLCVENLYLDKEIPYIFRHIKHDKLRICFDTGHQHFLTPKLPMLTKYSNYVEVLHLHDNHGVNDEHLICGKGTIDWGKIALGLKNLPDIVLSAEVKNKDESEPIQEFLADTYTGLEMIENLISN